VPLPAVVVEGIAIAGHAPAETVPLLPTVEVVEAKGVGVAGLAVAGLALRERLPQRMPLRVSRIPLSYYRTFHRT